MATVTIQYYLTQQDAVGDTNSIASAVSTNLGDFTTGDTQGFEYWFIGNTSPPLPFGGFNTTDIYGNGTTLVPDGGNNTIYFMYPVRIVYYSTQAGAAIGNGNYIARNLSAYEIGTDILGSLQGVTSWRIDHTNIGAGSTTVYTNGSVLPSVTPANTKFVYYLYPVIPCFLEGSRILCEVEGKEEYIPVETLRQGTLVKTSRDGFKPVELIGKRSIKNPGTTERTEERLYKCSPAVYPELTEDLMITGCHSILVDTLTDVQRAATEKSLGKIFVTDRKYRLMAHIDERAEPWASEGDHTVWHFALENTDITMNYGVYANGGLLVETCSINFLKNKSNMALIE